MNFCLLLFVPPLRCNLFPLTATFPPLTHSFRISKMLDAAELSLSVTFQLSAIIIFLDFQCPAAFTANYSRLND